MNDAIRAQRIHSELTSILFKNRHWVAKSKIYSRVKRFLNYTIILSLFIVICYATTLSNSTILFFIIVLIFICYRILSMLFLDHYLMSHGVWVNSVQHHELYTIVEEQYIAKQHKFLTCLRKNNLCTTKHHTPPIFLLPGKDNNFFLQTTTKRYLIFDPFELERASTQSIEMIYAIVAIEVYNFQNKDQYIE